MSLTRFKQKLAEFFNKEKKSIDAQLKGKLYEAINLETYILKYKRDIELFVTNAVLITQKHHTIAFYLKSIYKDSEYEDNSNEINTCFSSTVDVKQLTEDILKEISQLTEGFRNEIKEIKKASKSTEEKRIFYDHYRAKILKLEKSCKKSHDPKKQERLIRNRGKLDKATTTYEAQSKKLHELVDILLNKKNEVINRITLRFTRDIQTRFFENMNLNLAQLENMDLKFDDVDRKIKKEATASIVLKQPTMEKKESIAINHSMAFEPSYHQEGLSDAWQNFDNNFSTNRKGSKNELDDPSDSQVGWSSNDNMAQFSVKKGTGKEEFYPYI